MQRVGIEPTPPQIHPKTLCHSVKNGLTIEAQMLVFASMESSPPFNCSESDPLPVTVSMEKGLWQQCLCLQGHLMVRRPTVGPSLLGVKANTDLGSYNGRRCVPELCVRFLARSFSYLVGFCLTLRCMKTPCLRVAHLLVLCW